MLIFQKFAAFNFSFLFFLLFVSNIHSKDCSVYVDHYRQGFLFYQRSQYLLSSFHFSSVFMSDCDQKLSNEARFSYLLAMYHMGETKEILDQLEYLDAGKSYTHYKSLLFYGFVFNKVFPEFKDVDLERFSIWSSRNDKDLFEKKLMNSSLEDSSKHIILKTHLKYWSYPKKNPVLAGILSIIPGLGQIYTESYQSAMVALMINALFALAVVELFVRDLYYTGIGASLVLSVTYIGNILNAVNSAHQFNRSSSKPYLDRLQNTLFPEFAPAIR